MIVEVACNPQDVGANTSKLFESTALLDAWYAYLPSTYTLVCE